MNCESYRAEVQQVAEFFVRRTDADTCHSAPLYITNRHHIIAQYKWKRSLYQDQSFVYLWRSFTVVVYIWNVQVSDLLRMFVER